MNKIKGQKCKCGNNKIWLPAQLGAKSKPCPFCNTVYTCKLGENGFLTIVEKKDNKNV